MADFFSDRLVSAFSRMLIHSLWQGLVLAACVSLVLLVIKRWKAAARYNLVLMMLPAFLFTCLFTFIYEWNHFYAESTATVFTASLGVKVSALFAGNLQPLKQVVSDCNTFLTAHAFGIVMIWLIIFAVRIIKMTGALLYNQQMKSRRIVMPDVYWKQTIERLCAALKIDKVVVLLESGYMKVPVVIGHFKPVILMPAGLLMSLPADQVEAILLHELAHIRRNDYLVNLLQHIVETIFFFNPAVLWVSAWINEERENCCDDMALAQTLNKNKLAEALISFKQHELYGNSYRMAFPGKKNQLLRRVSRILGNNKNQVSVKEKIFFGMISMALIVLACAMPAIKSRNTIETVLASNYQLAAIPAINPVSSVQSIAATKQLQQKTPAIKKKVTVIEKKTFIIKPVETITTAIHNRQLPMTDPQMAMHDAEQAKKDQLQAVKDQARAMIDQQQALLDQKQAMLDQLQAERDQLHAKLDQEQAMKDQANAKLQQEKFNTDRQRMQALKEKKEAEEKMFKINPF